MTRHNTASSHSGDGERSQKAAQTTPTAAGNSQRRRGVSSGSDGVFWIRSAGSGTVNYAPTCRRSDRDRSVYSVTPDLHTPRALLRHASRHAFKGKLAARLSAMLVLVAPMLAAQASIGAGPQLDALSITVQTDSITVARGTLRLRQVRAGNDVELVATGIVVRKGLRVTAELRSDTTFALRKYVAESRDSTGRVIDRIQVTSAGGRVTLERVTPTRRSVREYTAQRELVLLDSAAVVPFVALAGLGGRLTALVILDVRRGTLTAGTLAIGASEELTLSDVVVRGIPVTVTGLPGPLRWWRDTRGRLLRVVWSDRNRVLRDDPPV